MHAFSVSARSAVTIVTLFALVASGFLITSSSRAEAPATPDLENLMSQINRAYRMVKAQVADKAQNEKTLAAVSTMQTAAITAKSMTPPVVAKLAEAERPAKLIGYRKEMVKLIRALLELEDDLLANDNTKAAAMIATLDAIQKEGHAEFRPE